MKNITQTQLQNEIVTFENENHILEMTTNAKGEFVLFLNGPAIKVFKSWKAFVQKAEELISQMNLSQTDEA